MKQVIFSVLTAGVILSAGCSKKEEPAPPEVAPKAMISEQAEAASKDVTQKTETVTAQATEKIAAVTEQAKTATREVAQKIEAVKTALTVKPDQVMAELNQPVADIKAKVAALGQPELLAYASTYKDVLLEKKDQLAGLTGQLKALPMSDMLGAKGKAVKDQFSQYTSQLSGLKERYSVYLDKLKSLGVDLSAFGI